MTSIAYDITESRCPPYWEQEMMGCAKGVLSVVSVSAMSKPGDTPGVDLLAPSSSLLECIRLGLDRTDGYELFDLWFQAA